MVPCTMPRPFLSDNSRHCVSTVSGAWFLQPAVGFILVSHDLYFSNGSCDLYNEQQAVNKIVNFHFLKRLFLFCIPDMHEYIYELL